ncbi:hypothetical protein [Lysinibacillus antri]|uniref:Uncharacterized protein n=1 Tax=Lysinibacillus antri TaxID=2498145 RepID=A0A3S0P4Z2_9BACI|nr:hypothetical protein [Lysinibacillus antri]RUL54225.1 hypothetical protein EK386_06855 [Lysinibacillus antri]
MRAAQQSVPFTKNRVLLTLFLHLLMGIPFSLLPEVNVRFWFAFNVVLAIILAFINYIIWLFYKDESKRYFSLHSFVMMMGIAYYAMSPAFRSLYPTAFFWLLLMVTVGLVAFLIIRYDSVTIAIVNPQHILFKKLIMVYSFTFIMVGALLWVYIVVSKTGPFVAGASILYFGGLFFIMISPAMLATPERVKEILKHN